MEGYSSDVIQGESTVSFADAVVKALEGNPGETSHRVLTVVGQEVEEGGAFPAVIYRVTLNPQPLPPAPEEAEAEPEPEAEPEAEADLNPQPLPPEPPELAPGQPLRWRRAGPKF